MAENRKNEKTKEGVLVVEFLAGEVKKEIEAREGK